MNSASSYSPSSEESINKEFLADEDEDVTSKLLDIGDETVDKLISQGINAEDVKRLKEAGILTCHSLLLLNTKKKLIEIEGLSEEKVDKILEAAEKLVDSVSIFLKEHQMKEQRAETVESLRSQIQITSDPDPLVRRGAMLDIRDMLKRNPDIVKPHTFAMVRAFQRHIADEDEQNRELSYSVLDALISNDLKEGDLTMALRMLIQSVLEALTLPNATTYVKISAFKFLARLVFRFHFPLLPLEVEKVIENCGMFLMDNQYTVHDKLEIQDSLNSFLTLLPWNRKGTQFIFEEKESDVQDDYLVSCYSFCNVIERLKYVVRAIIFCFRQLATAQKSPDGYRNIYGCMASLLENINLIAVSFTKSKYQDSLDGKNINVWDDYVSKSFHQLFQHFPLSRNSHPFNELDTSRLLDLNMVIAKIYLQLYETCPPQHCMQYLDNFLGFIAKVLNGKFVKFEESDEAIWGTHLNELVYLVPRLIEHVTEASNNMQSHNLLQAFTHAFMESKLDSKVKLACLYAIEDMLSHMHTRFACFQTKKEKAEYITTILEWMGVYTSLLKQLFPTHSLVAIRVLRNFGQWIREHPSLLEKYDTIQCLLPNFLWKYDEGREPYFLCLPTHYENMLLFCFMYFSTMEWPLLNLMLKWCMSPPIDIERILKILDLVHSFIIPTKLKVADYVKFSITLVSQFKASVASRRLYLKEITSIFCSYLQDNSDYFCDGFREIEKRIVEEMVQKPYLDNAFSLLKMLATMLSEDVTLSEETLLTLDPLLLKYLTDVEELADDGVHQATILWEKAKQYALENY